RTRETVAELLDRKLHLDEAIVREIQERFRRFARTMPEINKRQAMVPEGATVLPNPRGTAPALWLEADGHIIVLLPGVPHELKSIFETEVRPRLAKISGDERLFTRDLRTTGLGESDVETRVRPLYQLYPDTETTILAAPTGTQLHPRTWSRDAAKAEKLLDEITDRMALALGEHLYSTRGEALEEVVARVLTENRATVAVAESCTGGLLAERLTRVPGSSSYFFGGGTPEKPVGLVHIGLADEHGPRERAYRFPGDRERIRQFAAQAALDAVRRYYLFPAAARA